MSEPLTPTFVSYPEVHGFQNGIINIKLVAVSWNVDENNSISSVAIPAVDLRFDLLCAQQIHEALGKILAEQTKKPTERAN